TEIIAGERGFTIDKQGFEEQLAIAKEKSRQFNIDAEVIGAVYKEVAGQVGATRFLGYSGRGTQGEGTLRALVVGKERVPRAATGDRVAMAFDQTPFYAESGGQIGDTGVVETAGGAQINVFDTKKPAGDVYVLFGEVVRGELEIGEQVRFAV